MYWTRSLCLVALAMSGCITIKDTVKDRMSIDTGCAPDAIAVTTLPGSAYRATGCGQVATFVCTETAHSPVACTKEAATEPAVQPPPPPAPH
jgi:hypothetical protein